MAPAGNAAGRAAEGGGSCMGRGGGGDTCSAAFEGLYVSDSIVLGVSLAGGLMGGGAKE